jgi:hypothetical protein
MPCTRAAVSSLVAICHMRQQTQFLKFKIRGIIGFINFLTLSRIANKKDSASALPQCIYKCGDKEAPVATLVANVFKRWTPLY